MAHLELAILALQTVTLGGLGWLCYLFRKQRRYIGSLSSDAVRNQIQPERVEQWRRGLAKARPGSVKWRAYKAALERIGESQ